MSKTDNNPDCIFCKIVSKQIPAALIYEDANVISFLDLRPTSKGHTLVVPKVHSATFLETPDAELVQIIPTVRKVAAGVVAATGATGFNLSVNNGADAGQIIFHLHFHIVPRYPNDPKVFVKRHESDGKTLDELAAHIQPFIK